MASLRLQHTPHTVCHHYAKRYFGVLTINLAAQDDENEAGPAVPTGNQEHIIGTGGESETLDPSTHAPEPPSNDSS
jgi:hypothetical protein